MPHRSLTDGHVQIPQTQFRQFEDALSDVAETRQAIQCIADLVLGDGQLRPKPQGQMDFVYHDDLCALFRVLGKTLQHQLDDIHEAIWPKKEPSA